MYHPGSDQKQLLIDRELYKYYKNKKICVQCKKNKAHKRKVRCLDCLDKDKYYRQTKRDEKKRGKINMDKKTLLTEEEIEQKKQADYLIENKVNNFLEFKQNKEIDINTCLKMIEKYKDKINNIKMEIEQKEFSLKNNISYLVSSNNLKFRNTKTQKIYETPSVKYIEKLSKKDFKLKEDIDYKKIPEDFIKTKLSVDWRSLKAELILENDQVINSKTGEIFEECIIYNKEGEVQIKILD